MLKLYRFGKDRKEYWETWNDAKGIHTIHWGELGTQGQTREIRSTFMKKAEKQIQREIDAQLATGFQPVDKVYALIIEYEIDGFGTVEDLDKRHRLQARMDETLGWTGLGHCDGGSIGSGTMETCNYVVDYGLAKQVVETDLQGTEFANYSRIYREGE